MVDVGTIIFYVIAYSLIGLWGTVMIIATLFKMIKNRADFFTSKKRDLPPNVLVDGWNHARVKLKDVSLHYVSAGDDGKPLMLMVHGFPEFWYSWRHQLKEFKKDFKVVAIDMRGYGDSDKPTGTAPYDIELLTRDISELIPALGYKSCVLMGHDWGGIACWRAAAQYPQLIEKLIVFNCPHPGAFRKAIMGGDYMQMLKSWYMFAFQLPYVPELYMRSQDYKAFELMAYRKNGKKPLTDEDVEAWKYTFSQPGALTPPINYYRRNLWNKEVNENDTKKIKAPVLIIWGSNDKALGKGLADGSLEFCENGTVKYVEDATHWVQQDEPLICNQYIQQFVH